MAAHPAWAVPPVRTVTPLSITITLGTKQSAVSLLVRRAQPCSCNSVWPAHNSFLLPVTFEHWQSTNCGLISWKSYVKSKQLLSCAIVRIIYLYIYIIYNNAVHIFSAVFWSVCAGHSLVLLFNMKKGLITALGTEAEHTGNCQHVLNWHRRLP